MADCFQLLKRCQRQGERKDWGFTWTPELVRRRLPDTPYGAGVCIRLIGEDATGLQYRSAGGQSSGLDVAEINWPTTIGESVQDGTVLWTAEAITVDSLEDQIATSDWEAPAGSNLVVDDDSVSQTAGLQQTAAFVDSALSVAGRRYDVVNKVVTANGRKFDGVLRLTIDL